jgi:hypothetical protein
MDWICFIFKRGFRHYLVVGESEDNAYEVLANRQSMSVERCKKEYELIDWMNGMGTKTVVKL